MSDDIELRPTPFNAAWFGCLFVGVAGFMSGSLEKDRRNLEFESTELALDAKDIDGVVVSSQHRKSGKYEVGYTFTLATGQVYQGEYDFSETRNPGTPLKVVYAEHDPIVSRPKGQPPSRGQSDLAFIPPIFAVIGIAGMTLIMRRNQIATGTTVAWIVVWASAFGLAYFITAAHHDEKYCIQVGQEAWTMPSLTYCFNGVNMSNSAEGLTVNGVKYGPVPDRAHVWIRDDGVLVNNRLAPTK